MDSSLCDELLQEIFQKLPSSSSSSSSIPLVSKRWLQLYRTSKTSLSLRLPPPHDSALSSLSTLFSCYPFLSALSVCVSADCHWQMTSAFSDRLLLLVSSFYPQLRDLRFLTGPVSPSSIASLSNSCSYLTSLCIDLSRPLAFGWVAGFPFLKDLSIFLWSANGIEREIGTSRDYESWENEEIDAELRLESLCLSGIRSDDWGFSWLWRSSTKLQKLKLRSCEGIGDGGSYSSFVKCLPFLQEVELRRCRSIVDGVLLRLAENSISLISLLVYDGGSREGLLRFISQCHSNLQKLNLRLPLDLNNDHLSAIATNFRSLSTLRLQSCCLITGECLQSIAIAMNSRLKELALINCDVVETESGLLAALGQSLKHLRILDLSFNEMLLDKEFISMVVSCDNLVELKLRGCKKLSNLAVSSLFKSCRRLEKVDLTDCCGIDADAIELLVVSSPRLRCMEVEDFKLSDVARTWASHKFIELIA